MKDNNTNSKLENMKIDDDSLEAVTGGAEGEIVIQTETSLYDTPGWWCDIEVARVPSGQRLVGVTRYNKKWLAVPVLSNMEKIIFVDQEWFSNYKNRTMYMKCQ